MIDFAHYVSSKGAGVDRGFAEGQIEKMLDGFWPGDPETITGPGQPAEDVQIDPNAGDACTSAYFAFERLAEATTIGQQSSAFIDLSNTMSDMVSHLPGWDIERGELLINDKGEDG
jgi:hypothetical protein